MTCNMNMPVNPLAKAAYRVALFSDLHATRFTLAIAEAIWGITLLMPGDTFGRPTYKVMQAFWPNEDGWGALWIVTALLQLWILYRDNYHSKLSVIFAGYNSMLWWFVTVSMYLSVTPPPAAISGETALSFAATWIWVRSGWIPTVERRVNHDDY